MFSRNHLSVMFLLLLLSSCMQSRFYLDDFSDPQTGWGAESQAAFWRGYNQGRYLMEVDLPNYLIWTTS